MFIGHFAVGMAGKRVAPTPSMAWWLAAPCFLDLLWPIFLLLGWESVRIVPGDTAFTPLDLHDYPYTHSLVMAVGWSIAFALVYRLTSGRGDRRGGVLLALGVFSHFVLDWITHRPDMPLWPGSSTRIGLGLWNSRPGTIAVEVTMFVLGVLAYATGTRARDRQGAISWWGFVAFLSVMYLATAFGPPPPNVPVLIGVALFGWIVVPWGRHLERHRQQRDTF